MAFEISRAHSLKTRLLTVFWALTAAMLYYAISAIMTDWRELKTLDYVADAQQVAITSGGLAHELQKERGLSAGFISSRGEKFSDALQSQRKLTDQQFEKFNNLLTQVDASQLGKIDRGESSEGGRTLAKIGMWLGIVNVILSVLFGLVYVLIIVLAIATSN